MELLAVNVIVDFTFTMEAVLVNVQMGPSKRNPPVLIVLSPAKLAIKLMNVRPVKMGTI